MLCSSLQGFAHLKFFGAAGDSGKGVSFSSNTAIPDISFGTLHVYPEALGVNFSSSGDTDNYTWVNDYFIQPRAAQTAKLAKPLMIEEFGLTPAYGQANNVSDARLDTTGELAAHAAICCCGNSHNKSSSVASACAMLYLPQCAVLCCAILLGVCEVSAHSLQICSLTVRWPLTPHNILLHPRTQSGILWLSALFVQGSGVQLADPGCYSGQGSSHLDLGGVAHDH